MPTPRKPRTVVIFDGSPELSRQQRIGALTGLGVRHPAWQAVRQVLCDHLVSWHERSLAVQNAGTPAQTHACGAQSGLAEALAELDELMEQAVDAEDQEGVS